MIYIYLLIIVCVYVILHTPDYKIKNNTKYNLSTTTIQALYRKAVTIAYNEIEDIYMYDILNIQESIFTVIEYENYVYTSVTIVKSTKDNIRVIFKLQNSTKPNDWLFHSIFRKEK